MSNHQKIDQELAEHLDELKFQPMICGIRWIRLIYIREFKLEQVYNLWDYIMLQYKNSKNFESVEDIALSMLIHLRPSLMKCKNNLDIIQKVQRYPEIKCSLPLIANSLKIHSKLHPTYLTHTRREIQTTTKRE